MAQQTDVQLTTEANIIGNETVAGANTADRVRDLLINAIDSKINNDKIETDSALATALKTVAGRDAVKAYIDTVISTEVTARNSAISTAITNLINGAPGALDTLEELAAALADDQNFATTITNALATKQNTSAKDATGGYAGLTLFKINFKNALDTFISFFTNANTAARTYTFPDRDDTIATLQDVQVVITNAINGAVVLDDTAFGKVNTLTDNGGVADYTVTIPAPSAGNLGKTIYFKGLITLTKVVTLSNGAVTIAGEANWKLSKSGLVGLLSDGTNYVVIAEVGSWIAFTPTWTGFSANPTSVTARYFRQGRKCTYYINMISGTSNATTLTVTAPFVVVSGPQVLTRSQNNGTWGTGILYGDGVSNILTANSTTAAAAYTGTGVKGVTFLMEFEL